MTDLCRRGLLTLNQEALSRLEESERNLQSYKLMRFSRELAALRTRYSAALRDGGANAAILVDRLARLHAASAGLRALLDEPSADPRALEDLAGRTWRETDLEFRENVPLAELAWESVRLEEGFRVDTSYFLAPGGEARCERKIIPLGLRGSVDEGLKPQYPRPFVCPAVGVYPGDRPQRIRLKEAARGKRLPHARVLEMARQAPVSLEVLKRQWLERWRRPFPPDSLPVILGQPMVSTVVPRNHPQTDHSAGPDAAPANGGARANWIVLDRAGSAVRAAPPPGEGRSPGAKACLLGFEDCALAEPLEALLLLLFDDGAGLAAAPVGAVTPERVVRFGLDTAG